MNNPDWFILIKRWRERGMGQYGVGLPFLVGAIVAKKHSRIPLREDAERIVRDMIDHPVQGFVIEATWCAGTKIPVFRATPQNSPQRVTLHTVEVLCPASGMPALVFDMDLANMWGREPDGLLTAVIDQASVPIAARTFSRHGIEWGDFSEKEIRFIEEEIMERKHA